MSSTKVAPRTQSFHTGPHSQQPHASFIVLDGTTLELERDVRPAVDVGRVGARGSVAQKDSSGHKAKGNPILRSHQSGLGTTHSHNAGHGHHGHSFGPLSDSSPQRGNVGTHLSRHLEQLAFTQRTLHQHPRGNLRAPGPLENSNQNGDGGLVAKGVAVTLHSDLDGDESMARTGPGVKGSMVRLNLHVDTANLAGPAGSRYDNWDAQLTQRTSADSPRWVAFRAQESPDDLRPESNGLGGLDAPPLTPSILRLTSDSRGSCGPMWSSQELAELPFIGDDDPVTSSAATSGHSPQGTAALSI